MVRYNQDKGNYREEKQRHVQKFRRGTPAVRREALIEATLRCLKKYGHEGVFVRRISTEAEVSIGFISPYSQQIGVDCRGRWVPPG